MKRRKLVDSFDDPLIEVTCEAEHIETGEVVNLVSPLIPTQNVRVEQYDDGSTDVVNTRTGDSVTVGFNPSYASGWDAAFGTNLPQPSDN